MIYSNPEFVLFFLVTAGAFFLARGYEARFRVLLAASLVFYAWAGLFDTLIFIFVVVVSWLATALTNRYPDGKAWFIRSGIVLMTAHLFFWKYAPWAVGQVQIVFPSFWGGQRLSLPLPIGISFFTLQGIAYLVDYSRAEAKYMPLSMYLLFKSFFAQLVAGPIVRAWQLLPQLEKLERPSPEDVSIGLMLFTRGFFKKLVIGDRVGYFVDIVFSEPASFGRMVLLKALLGYTVQIWADFSGYTDMGRGAARILGIRLPENFLSPYLARTPSEFWRRWHITLSQWIKDYIYMPLALGGGRGALRGVGIVVLTMAISGLWHGASWHFVIWGLYHGVLLGLEHHSSWRSQPSDSGSKAVFQTALTLSLVVFGWLIFRVENLEVLAAYLGGLWSDAGVKAAPSQGLGIVLGVVYCALDHVLFYRDARSGELTFLEPVRAAVSRIAGGDEAAPLPLAGTFLAGTALAAVFIGSIVMRPAASKAFIYFQF